MLQRLMSLRRDAACQTESLFNSAWKSADFQLSLKDS
jgi:hypothetical protein